MVRSGLLVLVVSACGRLGFDHGGSDGGTPDVVLGSDLVTFGEGDDATMTSVTADTFLDGATTANNNGGSPLLEADAAETPLVRFDLTALPPGIRVATARLRLWTNDNSSPGGVASIYALREAWDEGGQQGAPGVANWIERTPGLPWSGPGATPPSRDATPLGQFAPNEAFTAYDVVLDAALVQSWVSDPTTNHGVMLVLDSGNGADFFASEASDATMRPSLQVSYDP